ADCARTSVAVIGKPGSADALVTVDEDNRGDHLAGHQPVFARELVDDLEAARDPVGPVDNDRRYRNTSTELKQPVAVRLPIAVEARGAAQDGRAAGGMRHSKVADQPSVDRRSVMEGGRRRVDHQLLP